MTALILKLKQLSASWIFGSLWPVDLLETRRNAYGLNPAKRVKESYEPRPATDHLSPAGASSETGLTLYF